MIHLNGNKICVIDCETTGFTPGKHDLIQICILPLDFNLNPDEKYVPFQLEIKPRYPENVDLEAMSVNRRDLHTIMTRGMDSYAAADLFEEWTLRLNLPQRKFISPLGHNWVFDKAFVEDWLGSTSFNSHFDGRYRDTLPVSLFINDTMDNKNEPCPFPAQRLSALCCRLGIEWDVSAAHDAVYDCYKTAELYRTIVKRMGKFL